MIERTDDRSLEALAAALREMPTSVALLRIALSPPTVGSLSLIQSFANELPESTWTDLVRLAHAVTLPIILMFSSKDIANDAHACRSYGLGRHQWQTIRARSH